MIIPMNFYKSLEQIISSHNPSEKFELFDTFYTAYREGRVVFEKDFSACSFSEPSYSTFCKVVHPLKVPKRRKLTTDRGKIILLHAIAHIEYTAIDLALDHAYRFQNLEEDYYRDWLEVADDEIRHFNMLNTMLESLGAHYGDLEVHNSLFEAAYRTEGSLVDRMAMVPRYLEANGLDATPAVLERLRNLPSDPILEQIIRALQIILDEEIDHVLKGDRWFAYACEKEGVSPDSFFEIIEKYSPGAFPKRAGVNIEARKAAGFSCSEMKQILSGHECE